jgi:ABC-type multidrug transport system ATPase subunit
MAISVRDLRKSYGDTPAVRGISFEVAPAEVFALVGSLSGGERRRVDVALGIVGDPDLLFLDEPTTGFDPSARRDAWRMIDGLRELGKRIVLTTHYMGEAQRLADRVAIMCGGELWTAAGIVVAARRFRWEPLA